MKIKISILLAFITLTLYSFSQNDNIQKIREIYNSVNEETTFHELNLTSILPAVGPKYTNIKFFYYSWQKDPENDPYDMGARLVKIEIQYNVSSHSHYKTEYLFNDQYQLIFFYNKAEGEYENFEKRFYFNNNRLIKYSIKMTNDEGISSQKSSNSNFTNNVKRNAESKILKAEKYKKLFDSVLSIENIE